MGVTPFYSDKHPYHTIFTVKMKDITWEILFTNEFPGKRRDCKRLNSHNPFETNLYLNYQILLEVPVLLLLLCSEPSFCLEFLLF